MLTNLSNPKKNRAIYTEIYSVEVNTCEFTGRSFRASFSVHVTVETPRAAREPGLGNPCCVALTVRILGWTRGARQGQTKVRSETKSDGIFYL